MHLRMACNAEMVTLSCVPRLNQPVVAPVLFQNDFTTARSKSCNAPATISEAEAPLTRIINGISIYRIFSCFIGTVVLLNFDFVVTIVSFLGTNKLQIFTASFNSPPGLSLTSSIMRSCFLVLPAPLWFRWMLFY
jgi:hypothetical protein